jgi:hypothetical protein
MKNNIFKRYIKLNIAFALTIIFIVSSFFVVGAITYTISTNDANGVSEWFDQAIPIFQTDASGDTSSSRPDEDIVNAWIAKGYGDDVDDEQLYFMVEMAGNPAISKPDEPFNGVGVWLDCDANGSTTDSVDRFVSYYYAAGYDRVSWFRGSDGYGGTVDDPNLGQIDQQYVEWTMVPTLTNGLYNCMSQINVKFLSVQSEFAAGFQTISDETDSFRGFDFPTVIHENIISGSSRSPSLYFLIISMILAVLSGAALLIRLLHNFPNRN